MNYKYDGFNNYNNLEGNQNIFDDNQQNFGNNGNLEDRNALLNGSYQYRQANGVNANGKRINGYDENRNNNNQAEQTLEK